MSLSSPHKINPPVHNTGGLITALGIAQICSWGSLYYAFPLIAAAMQADLGWSRPTLYGAATLGLLFSGLLAYPVGALIDRGHGRWLMAGASLLAGVLFFLWSQVESVTAFYLTVPLVGALQAATLYEPAFAVISRRVGAQNARNAITALTLWGGFASTVFIPLTQLLIDLYGWRGALACLAGVNLVLCTGLYGIFIDPRRDSAKNATNTGAPTLTGNAALAWALRKSIFWALLVTCVAYAATFSALSFHLYPMFLEKGLTTSSVVGIIAVIGPAQVAGRILVRLFAHHAPVRNIGMVIVAIFPAAIALYALVPPNALLLGVIAAIYGAANGMMTIVRGLAVPEMLSREAYGAINGALTGPANIVQAAAPLGAAMLWSIGGNYAPVWIAIFCGALVVMAAFWAAALLSRKSAISVKSAGDVA